MLGYYENSTATAESLTEDRTLKTGDFAYRNKGLFFISSRRTDLILRGAENVYPQEIELLLARVRFLVGKHFQPPLK